MAQRVEYLWGQAFQNGTAKQIWLYTGFADIADVDARIKAFNDGEVPLVWAGLPIDTNWDLAEVGGGVFTATISFSAAAGNILDPTADSTADHPQQGGDAGADQEVASNVSFSVRTGTLKITQSYETVSSAAVGTGPAPGGFALARNFGRAINVNVAEGKVEGFEVYAGEPVWKLVGKVPAALVTGAFQKRFQALYMPRPKLNGGVFFGYQKGELLFLDGNIGEASSNGFRDIDVTLGVKLNQDVVTISLDPYLELYDVGGWSVVWVTYKDQTQTLGGLTRSALLPFEAFEERVYEYGDFADLNIVKFKTSPPPPPPPP